LTRHESTDLIPETYHLTPLTLFFSQWVLTIEAGRDA